MSSNSIVSMMEEAATTKVDGVLVVSSSYDKSLRLLSLTLQDGSVCKVIDKDFPAVSFNGSSLIMDIGHKVRRFQFSRARAIGGYGGTA